MTSSFAASAAPTERTPLFPAYIVDLLSGRAEADIPPPRRDESSTGGANRLKRAIGFLTCGTFCCGGTVLDEPGDPANGKEEEESLMTCQICFDDQVALEHCFFCMSSCIFCEGCTRTGIETAIADGEIKFPCFLKCGSEISYDTIQTVLPVAAFTTLVQRVVSDEVQKAKIKGLESCPHCNFAMILPSYETTFRCMNEECQKETCRRCKRASHAPLKCDQVENDEDVRRRTYIENKMTEALTRTCYNCNRTFIKTEGCNKMKCHCGAIMCYLCREAIDGYEHFQTGKCALFSDDNAVNLQRILLNADRAKRHLGNVKLKVDPTRGIHDYYNNK